MKQSRLTSLFKSLVSTAVGFGVAYLANMVILPLFGLPLSHSANLLLTTIYTVISIVRGYVLERVFELLRWRQRISPFMAAVIAERQRQQDVEGWSIEHDDEHRVGELADAGVTYAEHACEHLKQRDAAEIKRDRTMAMLTWPWDDEWWKPQGFRRDLVKGCALIAAEGEKFDRSRKSRHRESDSRVMHDRPDEHSPRLNPNNLAHNKTASEHAGSST